MKNRVAWRLVWVLALLLQREAPAGSGCGPRLADTPFPDVPHGHPAAEAINELAQRGIVFGYLDSTFAGQRLLSRYEFAVAVRRLTEQPFRLDFPRFKPPSKPKFDLPILCPPFFDVPKVHWASGAVDWVREHGIVAGYADGTFRGDRPMNWNEVSIVTHRLRDFYVGLFGNEPSRGLETFRSRSGTGPDLPVSRYEFAVVLQQVEAFYGRVVEASVEAGA